MTSVTPYSVSEFTLKGLEGLGQPVYAAHIDVSANEIGAKFSALVNTINGIVTPSSSTTPVVLTSADKQALEDAINELRAMLMNGYTPVGAAGPQYMTTEMANQVSFIFQSLQAAGIDTTAPVITFGSLADAQTWQTLVDSSAVLKTLFSFVTNKENRSLQALIELNYVATGNDLISGQLSSLQEALSITKTSLDNLTALQNLHNMVTIDTIEKFASTLANPGGFDMTGTGMDAKAFAAAYKTAAEKYFGAPIAVTTSLFPADPLKNFELANPIAATTKGIVPTGPDTGLANYNKLAASLGGLASIAASEQGFVPLYLKWNSTSGLYDAYRMGDAVRDAYNGSYSGPETLGYWRSYQFSNAPFGTNDTIIYFNSNPDISNANTLFKDRYGMANATLTMTDPTNPNDSGSVNLTYSSPGKAGTLYKEMMHSILLNNKITPLADNTSRYFGVKDADTTLISNALGFFADIFQTLDITVPSPASVDPYTQKFWLGFDSVNNKFVVDSRNPTVLWDARNKLISAREAIAAEITKLTGKTDPNDPNTLLAKLKVVLEDLNKSFTTTGDASGSPITDTSTLDQVKKGMLSWLIDNNNITDGSAETGAYQTHLSFAITAGQSLNDTQNESIRRFLFIFEEYYKSASAILQQITQILQRIAQNVAR